jgi:hypothetical protein
MERGKAPHSSQKNKELAVCDKAEEAIPLLQAENGILHETSADEEQPVSLAGDDTASISISLSIREPDGSSVLEDHGLKSHITSLLNRERPSRLDVSLINKAGNCLGNAQFCTYTFGTEPKLPSPKPSRSSKASAKDTEEMKPVLPDKPFSEFYIGKTSRSIQGMQIEDIAWTYAEHFFNELEKKKDDNLRFSYYGYKLPEAHAFARIITPTIVYDLTLLRKEGVGSAASCSTVRTAKKYK